MLRFKQSDKKRSKDIRRNRSSMTMPLGHNYTSLPRRSRSFIKRSERLSTKLRGSLSNAILEIQSSLRKDSQQPSSKNSNKNMTRIESKKKYKSEERCLQDSWLLNSTELSEKRRLMSSSSRRTGLSNKHRSLLMNFFKLSISDFMRDKCR